MEIKIEELINKHKNKPCVIMGSVPSAYNFDYSRFKGIVIIIGGAINRTNGIIKGDYLISANDHFPIPEVKKHRDIINKFKNAVWILSDTACYSSIWNKNENTFKNLLKIDHCFFDHIHFDQKACSPKRGCCKFLKENPKRKMIYDIAQDHFGIKLTNKKIGVSVSDYGLTFAMLLGCGPIFIQGVDLPLESYKSIFKQYDGIKMPNKKELEETLFFKSLRYKFLLYYLKNFNFKPYLNSVIEKIKIKYFKHSVFSINFINSLKIMKWIKNVAKKRGIKIHTLGEVSTLRTMNIFEYLPANLVKIKYKKFFKN
jgi:hypothetical protein